jgi:hypothetical protein
MVTAAVAVLGVGWGGGLVRVAAVVALVVVLDSERMSNADKGGRAYQLAVE